VKVLAIATVTLRETLRRKVQVNLLIFGTLLVIASYFISALTMGDQHRMISDLGLSSMQLIGTLLAVFLGSGLVAGDVERRVLYPVVAKPVTRTEYLLGRYLGLSAALLLNLAVMAAALAAALVVGAGSAQPLDAAFLGTCAMTAVQLLVVAAVAVLFSSITSTTLAAIFALSLAIAGQLTNEMRSLWRGEGAWLARALWYALPNLGVLTTNDAVIYHRPLPASTWLAAAYGLVYVAATLAVACVAFERRDFR
jgi:ABC-type transport system involved in multi-copper enzyme maturation permease subunit